MYDVETTHLHIIFIFDSLINLRINQIILLLQFANTSDRYATFAFAEIDRSPKLYCTLKSISY